MTMNEPMMTIISVMLALLALWALFMIMSRLYDKVAPVIKKTAYKICYGEPVEPYKIDTLPTSWRYNPRLFDNTRLFK